MELAGLKDAGTDTAGGAPGTGLVVKALNLLDLIAGSPGLYRAQSLADHLGLPRSTVYRILQTLQQRGMVRMDAGSQGYFPGFRFLDYAENVWPLPDLPLLSMTELRWLRELTGETVYFSVASGVDMVIVQKADGAAIRKPTVAIGSRRPVHCTAMGKAHLSALPPSEREQLLGRLTLTKVTERTVVDQAQLRSQLDVFRLRGYAIDDEELATGMRCVSVAVLGDGEAVLGTIAVAGPCFRMTMERAHQWGPEIGAAARRLGDAVRQRAGRRASRQGAPSIPLLTADHSFQGRFPCWDAQAGALIWADTLAPALLQANAAQEQRSLAGFDAPVLAMAPLGSEGWFVLAGTDGACTPWRVARDGTMSAAHLDAPPDVLAAVRGAAAGPDGALWLAVAGSGAVAGGLYEVLDGKPVLRCPFDASLGSLAFSPDGRTLYACSEASGDILHTSRSDAGAWPPLQPFTRIDTIHGRPAGLAVQRDGHVWLALRDGWGIARLSRDGREMKRLPLPVPRPSGLAFGGSADDVLYVTSERIGLSPQQLSEAPDSGGVFVLDRGLRDALLR